MSRIVILFKGKAKTNKINGVMNRVFFFHDKNLTNRVFLCSIGVARTLLLCCADVGFGAVPSEGSPRSTVYQLTYSGTPQQRQQRLIRVRSAQGIRDIDTSKK